MEKKRELIDYINLNWDMHPYESEKALRRMGVLRCPLRLVSPELYNKIVDLISDFKSDNNMPDEWEDEIDIDDLFYELDI